MWSTQLLATRDMPSYRKTIEELPSDKASLQGIVRKLRLYPIKSLGMPLSLTVAQVTELGLATLNGKFRDRQVLLGRRQNKALKPNVTHRLFSQRNFSKLCRCRVTYDGKVLTYHAPDDVIKPLTLIPSDLKEGTGTTIVEMHGKELACTVEGDGGYITQWVRAFLESQECPFPAKEIDVLFPSPDFSRIVADHHRRDQAGGILYADGGQLLISNAGTLGWMNDELKKTGRRTTTMDAFRPNIEIDLPPNAEDLIDTLVISTASGPVTLLAGLLSVRCTMIDIDADTGTAPDTAINDWLRVNRPHRPSDLPNPNGEPNKTTTFGLNMVASHESCGKIIMVGDTCTIAQEKQ
jgi:uncharacterized protein YcbX